jgi:HlyD family secretion protein
MDDTTQLLRSLAIDRRENPEGPPVRGRAWRAILTLTAVGAVLAVGAALWFARPSGSTAARVSERETSAIRKTPTDSPRQTPAPAAAAGRAEPGRGGALVASGYVVARRRATVAAEVTGKVVELLAEEGMTVARGQVLARLDSVLVEKDLALAQSKVQAAEAASAATAANLRDVERILARTRTLSRQSYASDAELTKAEARAAVLRAQAQGARADLETARLQAERTAALLEKHLIRAPFKGVVVERSAQPGEMISPMSAGGFTRTGVCTLVDMDSIEIEVDVNEAFIGRVHADAPVNAVLDAYPDWTIPAAVIAIVPTANREKATVKVRIGLKQKDPRILPDMAVKVTFLDGSASETASSSPERPNDHE